MKSTIKHVVLIILFVGMLSLFGITLSVLTIRSKEQNKARITKEGREAAKQGLKPSDNPYKYPEYGLHWMTGYMEEKENVRGKGQEER